MKSLLLTATAALLLAVGLIAPASASSDYLLNLDGTVAKFQEAVGGIQPPIAGSTELLPAIQKIREAANRMMSACGDPASGEVDSPCAASELSAAILEEGGKGHKDASPLLKLFIEGSGLDENKAKQFVRQCASSPHPDLATESMLTGILIGLLRECEALKMTDSVLDPLHEALEITSKMVRSGPTYDVKVIKK
ncbi:MAG: hypothetical protein ABI743_01000 [bacterium]